MFASALLSSALFVSAGAPCVLVPAFADPPPPQDPLLKGLGAELTEALSAGDWTVTQMDRSQRDDLCVLGQCPPELAQLAQAEVVIVPRLNHDLDRLDVSVYGQEGAAHTISRPCKWADGAIKCELKGLGKALEKGVPFDEQAVRRAVRAVRRELKACYKGKAPKEITVRYRARPKGRLSNVQILGRSSVSGPDACTARRLEALAIPMFTGRGVTLEQTIQFKKKAKKKHSRRRKAHKKK